MRLLALLLFFSGCAHIHDPQPIDTIFKPQVKNWEKIYADELKAAIKNEDGGILFFLARIHERAGESKAKSCN